MLNKNALQTFPNFIHKNHELPEASNRFINMGYIVWFYHLSSLKDVTSERVEKLKISCDLGKSVLLTFETNTHVVFLLVSSCIQ